MQGSLLPRRAFTVTDKKWNVNSIFIAALSAAEPVGRKGALS
jgi:hypothetical protein